MLVTTKKILRHAERNAYAVGAFNIDNLEMLQAVVWAARSQKSPAIIATSESSIRYAGAEVLKTITDKLTAGAIPFALHLDHGKDSKLIKHCIDIGWTSVMYDGSLFPYKENVKNTRAVVAYAHARGVSVEAELGALHVQEDGEGSAASTMTDPKQAKEFVRATGIDSLAIAIGTSHGAFKASGAVQLDYARLKAIRAHIRIPLVLHGASSLPASLQKKMHKLCKNIHDCLRLEGAQGVSPVAIKKCISLGIAKVNTGTDLRASFVAGIRESLLTHTMSYDERDFLKGARDLVQKTVEERMALFGSSNRTK